MGLNVLFDELSEGLVRVFTLSRLLILMDCNTQQTFKEFIPVEFF